MPQAPATSASSAATTSEARIRRLEQQLSIVTAERNDLAADVEALCMQSSGDIFSASSVLGDRISHVQKEANKLQRQLDAVTADRNSLHEDLINHRDSKRTVDKQWRLERERCERLESELAFYQNHSAQALSDRDKAVWEAEELKGQLLKTETELQDSRAALGTEADAHAEAERQLQQVRQHRDSLQVSCDIWHRDLMDCQRECNRAMHMRTRDLLEHWAEAEAKAKASEEIPVLRKDLVAARQLIAELERLRDSLQEELGSTQCQLEEVQEALKRSEEERHSMSKEAASAKAASDELIERLNTDNGRLEAEVTRLRRERAELEDRAEEAEGGLAAAQTDMETSRKRLEAELAATRTEARRAAEEVQLGHSSEATVVRSELEKLKREHEQLTAELSKATEERNSAQFRIAAAEDTATQAFEEVGNMRDEVADLKERLTKATQEKVAALMQAAEAKGSRRASGSSGKGPASSPAKPGAPGGGWRAWGSHTGEGSADAAPKAASDKSRLERAQNGNAET